MFKIGDQVAVIHENITGKILKIVAQKVIIEDVDGFERTYKVAEVVMATKDVYNVDSLEASEFIEAKAIEQKAQPTITEKSMAKTEVHLFNTHEIDLHIEVLYPEASNWSVADVLQKQMIACRAFIERAVAQHSKKVVLIHGKGEGVLKSEIYRYLNRVEDHLHIAVSYHDADFRTYGTGATQVNFKY